MHIPDLGVHAGESDCGAAHLHTCILIVHMVRTMSPEEAVRQLRAHVDSLRSARRINDSVTETTELARRRQVFHDLLFALKLRRTDLVKRLNVNQSTWTRWLSGAASPDDHHLAQVELIATGSPATEAVNRVVHRARDLGDSTRMEDLDAFVLLATNRTHARLRVFFNVIDWKNVILCFSDPWRDYHTVLNMAVLALRGCKVIYLLHSVDVPRFAAEFASKLYQMLGANDTARAMAGIAFIHFNPEHLKEKEFAAWNFLAGENSVAYAYEADNTRNKESGKTEKKEAENGDDRTMRGKWLCEEAVFYPLPNGHETFNDLEKHHRQLIESAEAVMNNLYADDAEGFWKRRHSSIRLILNLTGRNTVDAFDVQDYDQEENAIRPSK